MLGSCCGLYLKTDGTEDGRRCKVFDYMKRTIVTKAIWKGTLRDKITCLKSLGNEACEKEGYWRKSKQLEGAIYDNDK